MKTNANCNLQRPKNSMERFGNLSIGNIKFAIAALIEVRNIHSKTTIISRPHVISLACHKNPKITLGYAGVRYALVPCQICQIANVVNR